MRCPDSKVYSANMRPIWGRWAPCWPHEFCYLGVSDFWVLRLVHGANMSKVHGANMRPIWGRWAPCWPHEFCYLGISECWDWTYIVSGDMPWCINLLRPNNAYVSELIIIGSDNGLLPGRCQNVILINGGMMLIESLEQTSGKSFFEIIHFHWKNVFWYVVWSFSLGLIGNLNPHSLLRRLARYMMNSECYISHIHSLPRSILLELLWLQTC